MAPADEAADATDEVTLDAEREAAFAALEADLDFAMLGRPESRRVD